MRRTFKYIGTWLAILTPVVAIVACNEENNQNKDQITQKEITLGYNLVTLGKFIETNGAFVKDKNDPKWPVAIAEFQPNSQDKEPKYNLVKILDAGLTSKSLNDTWPGELKWWANSFAHALSAGLYNQNKIGADSDWDGTKGQKLGEVAKLVIDGIFTEQKDKNLFVKWADQFIEHRKAVKQGASAYSKIEQKLVGSFVHNFKDKAIKLALGMIKVWAARWNWNWDVYDASKLIRFVDYKAAKNTIQQWVNKNGSLVRIPKETNVTGFQDQKALNYSDIDHTFNQGWYNQALIKKQGSESPANKIAITISKIAKDQNAASLDSFTMSGGVFSGASGVNNNNWKKVNSGTVKMIYLGKVEDNGGKIFVRKDFVNSDSTLIGNSLEDKLSALRAKNNYDKYGKTVVWFDVAKKITKFWTIADSKMYFNFPQVIATKWTSAVGTERRYKTTADFNKLIEYATSKIKLLLS